MAVDNLPYNSIFTLFVGFLIFIAMILNKIHMFFVPLHDYFVLFLLIGILISSGGLVMTFKWQFENRKPFYEHNQQQKRKTQHFTPYLAFGILLILVGFFSIYYINIPNRNIFIMTMSISITGILLLINGLRYFVKEAIIEKTPRHS